MCIRDRYQRRVRGIQVRNGRCGLDLAMTGILVLAPLGQGWGNQVTALRIVRHLESSGMDVTVRDPSQIEPDSLQPEQYSLIFAFHAFRAGRHIPAGARAVLVLGGTDANECWDHDSEAVMSVAVAQAAVIVAFNQPLADLAQKKWPDHSARLRVISPSVVVPVPSEGYSLHAQLGVDASTPVLLLVAGIRPVKDPLFALEAMEQLMSTHPAAVLLVVGPSRDDDEYSKRFQTALAQSARVHYWPPIEQGDLMAAVKQARLLLNTSLSEGASNAILEAMSVGTVVVARNVPGNAALLQHEQTGLLFDTPAELVGCVDRLLCNEDERRGLAVAAQGHFEQEHLLEAEAAAYRTLVSDVMADDAQDR
eukprot:TRINITY_DN8892_c0_g1_i1.p1 TRINITY_DN8892_c0_g1~~TRINITY_DN8892_c0_g1_i1.p1  ORF type:complete len:365 (-),score=88.68 TRINITY_DN8892_c0_g1_i1:318-1412(-)